MDLEKVSVFLHIPRWFIRVTPGRNVEQPHHIRSQGQGAYLPPRSLRCFAALVGVFC
jgi:hypothetical protein